MRLGKVKIEFWFLFSLCIRLYLNSLQEIAFFVGLGYEVWRRKMI